MNDERIEKRIAQANKRLKTAKVGFQIVRRRGGKKLTLRGTLPPKPGSKNTRQKAGWLSLGLNATYDGISQAEKEAKYIRGLIDTRQFTWEQFLKVSPEKERELKSVGHFVEKLKHKKLLIDGVKENTWRKSYYYVFSHHLDEPLSEEFLHNLIVNESEVNTRNRAKKAIACGALADVAGIDGSQFRSMKGNYSVKSLKPRDLPTDKWIVERWKWLKEQSPEWAYVFGLMAVYGLRNHEAFYSDLTEYPILWVTRGKTGERHVYPFYPEWADQFELHINRLPKVKRKGHEGHGAAVTQAFAKYEVGTKPYNLRHCWAVRTIGAIPQVLAAAQMGHALSEHNRIYQYWMKRDTHQKAFDLYLNNPNRPKPPI